MYNYFMLIGKFNGIKEGATGMYEMKLAVERTFLEADGVRKTDHFIIQVPTYVGELIIKDEIKFIGKTVSVKGRLLPVMKGTSATVIAERIMWGD